MYKLFLKWIMCTAFIHQNCSKKIRTNKLQNNIQTKQYTAIYMYSKITIVVVLDIRLLIPS